MRVYIIYGIYDYADAIAITTNKNEAYKYINEKNKAAGYRRYFVESHLIGNGITDITASEGQAAKPPFFIK